MNDLLRVLRLNEWTPFEMKTFNNFSVIMKTISCIFYIPFLLNIYLYQHTSMTTFFTSLG